ncbi:MAG TPA: lipoyl(octanoyl) transferase LipB [Salinisphaeraceae bacterium]|nr:lipoyl(octanoyl) transferase LipB [Salinisphaeraceae bacterium]
MRHFGWTPQPYRPIWQAMRRYTCERDSHSADTLWLLQHRPVYTQGKNGRPEHLLLPGDIEVVAVDRGGQVTYHGPGQIMLYTLLDLKRLGLGVRSLVSALEQTVIRTLANYGIRAHARREAPGVYVDEAKIGSLGLRIRNGCSYHGLALNVAMDLEPFARINPCGYRGLRMTQVSDLGGPQDLDCIAADLTSHLSRELGLPPAAAQACNGP